jgi:hypothetical protein
MKKRQGSVRKSPEQSLSTEGLLLQPWFLDNRCASALRKKMPEILVHKMRFYFEDWGCLVCRSKKRRYGSNGMCHVCTTRIQKRLYWCLRRRTLKPSDQTAADQTAAISSAREQVDRVQIAKTLLDDIARREWSPNRLRLRSSVRRVGGVNSPGRG